MPWNFGKIREACRKNSLTCPEIHLLSLSWQHWKVGYHAQRAEEIWVEFRSAHTGGHEIAGGNEQWWEAYRTSAAETEATVEVINAEADIIAQVINKIILRNPLPEEEVSFWKVLKRLKRQNPIPNVATAIETFINSSEFAYIRAFCNTIKHRNLIEKEYRIESRVGKAYTEGTRFTAFCHKNHRFPITWASDINGPYRKMLGESVEKIGDAIIDDLA